MCKQMVSHRRHALALTVMLAVLFALPYANAADPALMKLLFERAQQRYEQGEYAGALHDLESVRAAFPNDQAVRYYYASCLLGLGDAESARLDYTILLQEQTTYVEAYLGRARAFAKLGDARRARKDLDTADRLNPHAADKIRPLVEKEVAMIPAAVTTQSPASLLSALNELARAGTSDDKLIEAAELLHKAMSAQRLRAYEIYQDRLRELEHALQGAPNNADRLAEYGKFLYHEAVSTRIEKAAEPRAPGISFRYQTAELQRREVSQAEEALDRALKVNPNHVKALAWRAAVYASRGQWDTAERLIDHARGIPTKNPDVDLLEMTQGIGDHKASGFLAEAAFLRAGKTEYVSCSPSPCTGSGTRYIPPTAAELARAAEFDRQAERLGKIGDKQLEIAAQSRAGTAEGYFYQGLLYARLGNYAAAKEQQQEAIKLAPKMFRAHDALNLAYNKLGMADEALEEWTVALNLTQTTAEPMLRATWDPLHRTAWKRAENLLQRAEKWDPDDSRIPTYRAILLEATDKPEDAIIQFKIALAMNEALARSHGTTLRPSGTGIRDPREFGRALAIRLLMGKLLIKLHSLDEALEVFRANTALAPRVDSKKSKNDVYTAMLPTPDSDPSTIPDAPQMGGLLAASHIGAAAVLGVLNRMDEAKQEMRAGGWSGRDVPKLNVGMGNDSREEKETTQYQQQIQAENLKRVEENQRRAEENQRRKEEQIKRLDEQTDALRQMQERERAR